MPADLSLIFTEVNQNYNTLDGSYIIVHENVIDSRRHCEFCSVIEFYNAPAGGTTEVSWSAGGQRTFSMEGAGKVSFYAMGGEGGGTVQFKAAERGLVWTCHLEEKEERASPPTHLLDALQTLLWRLDLSR